MTTLMSVWRYLSLEMCAVWKLVLTCYASRWPGLHMLWLFMLEGVFERTVKPRFAVSLGCSHCFYTKVCSRMTSGGDLYHAATSKLISVPNQWTGPCVVQFLLEGRSETMLHDWCGNGKYTTVICFGIGGGDARVPTTFDTSGCGGFWRVLWCSESLWDWGVVFILVQVRLHDVKKIL